MGPCLRKQRDSLSRKLQTFLTYFVVQENNDNVRYKDTFFLDKNYDDTMIRGMDERVVRRNVCESLRRVNFG